MSELTKKAAIASRLDTLLSEIRAGVIKNKGNAFSIRRTFYVTSVEYHKGLFGEWKRHSVSATVDRLLGGPSKIEMQYDLLMAAAKKLPKGISTTSQYGIIEDKRDERKRYSNVNEGHIVTINVSKEYSWNYFYSNYVKEGQKFCDYLISKHSALLKQIRSHLRADFFRVYLTNSGLTDDLTDADCRSVNIKFADYGMRDLENIQQVYGFALALRDANHISCDEYFIEDAYGGLCFEISYFPNKTETPKPNLTQW